MRNVLLGTLVILAVLIAGCGKKTDTPAGAGGDSGAPAVAKTTTPVSVIAVQPTNLDERVEVTGTLKAASEVVVGCRLAGRVSAILVKQGAPVKIGQLVATMDDGDQRSALNGANASLEAAKAHVEQAKAAAKQQVTSTNSGIQTAKAALDAAKSRLDQAKQTEKATRETTEAQVQAAQAALEVTQKHRDVVKAGARTQERTVAENAVKQAQANYDLDKSNYDRVKSLFDQGAVARSQVDAAQTKMQVSQNQLSSAQSQLDLLNAGARPEDVDAAEASVRQAQQAVTTAEAGRSQYAVASANVDIANTGVTQAQAALDQANSAVDVNVMRDKDVLAAQAAEDQAQAAVESAQNSLSYTQIHSPVNGVVEDKIADVGQSLGAAASILRLTTDQSLYLEATVSELEAARVQNGQVVDITVDALQGDRSSVYKGSGTGADATPPVTVKGTVERVVNVVDAKTRDFVVRILVPKQANTFPGMFARGSIIVAHHAGVLTVSKDALLTKGDKQVVFVAEDGTGQLTARAHEVTAGITSGTTVEVKTGLMSGDKVITEGQQSLVDGDPVTIKVNNGQ